MSFKGLRVRFHVQSRTGGGGGHIRETKILVGELWLKMGEGLYVRGGILVGHYGTCTFVERFLAGLIHRHHHKLLLFPNPFSTWMERTV